MKKLFTRGLLVFVLLTLANMGYAQKKVLSEDFQSAQPPSGWTTSGSYWTFQPGEVLFSSLIADGVDTLFTPMVNIAALENHPTLTLDYRITANQGNINPLTILYRTVATEAWTVLTTLDAEQIEPTRIYTLLPSAVTTNVQIAIASVNHLGGETALSYLALENQREATEAPANFVTEGLTTESVTIRWALNMSDFWLQNNLKISTFPLEDMSETADVFDGNVSANYYTLSNLTPNTTYYAYVRYECEDDDFSPWAELEWTTPCLPIEVPYTETFEGNLDNCYTVIRNSRKAEVNTIFPYNGEKAFQLLTNPNTQNYLFFPELNVPSIQAYQVSFYVASEVTGKDYSRELTIGVATEATAESFIEHNTIILPQGRQYERVTISFASYKGNGKVIAFRAGNASSENHIVIDDVTIEPADACPSPMFTRVSNISYNSARISWVEAGDATEWNMVIATQPYDDPATCTPDAGKGEFAGTVTTNPFNATDLQPETTYYVYLQAICSDGSWTQAVTFTTSKAITIPYQEVFDRFDPDFYTEDINAVPDQWVTGARGVNPDFAFSYDREYNTHAAYISNEQDHTNSAYIPASLKMRGTSQGSSQYYASYAMLPAMPVNLNQLMISFWGYTADVLTQIVVGIADEQSNEIAQGSQLVPGGNVTPIDTLSFKASKTWEQLSLSLHTYTGKGKYITLYVVPIGKETPNVFVDDIVIDYAPTCYAVRDLSAIATSTTSFKATWTESLNATEWKIKVSTTEIDPTTTDGDVIASLTVDQQEYTATNLQANTPYYIYVSPACGDLWESTSVTTLYALTIPYYNDFSEETTGNGLAPEYWINGNWGQDATLSASSTYRPYVYNTNWSLVSGTTLPEEISRPSLRFYSYYSATATSRWLDPYIILPEIVGTDVKDLVLSFWGYSNTTTKNIDRILSIGVMTDPTDKSTLTEVKSITVDTCKVPQYFMVDLSSYTGDGKYIVFYIDNQINKTYEVCIDNLSISTLSDPQQVTNLQVIDSTITTTSATLKWQENGCATSWKVRLFSEIQTDPETATPVKEYTATDTICQATGLTHSTQYFAYVQAIQGGKAGRWSTGISFWTECDLWELPFFEDFETYETGSSSNNTLPACYDVSSIGGTKQSWPYIKSYSAAGTNHPDRKNLLYMTGTSAIPIQQVVFPEFEKPVKNLQMTVEACGTSSYSGDQTSTYFGVVTPDGEFHEIAKKQVTAAKTWEEWSLDFSGYTGEDGRIAIRHDYKETGVNKPTYICLTNIHIIEIPLCKRIETVEITKITTNSALVSWEKAGEEATWRVKVSSTPLADPSAATADAFDGQVSTEKQALSDLQPNTTYYVYVQSVRADQDCASEWSKELSFTTLCEAIALPYTEDYEGLEKDLTPDCYILSGDIQTTDAARVSTTNWYYGGTNQLLRLSQTSVDKTNYCALPLVDCSDASELQLTMLVLPSAYGTAGAPIEECSRYFYEVGIMTDPHDPATYVAMFTDSIVADGTTTGKDKYYSFETYTGDEYGTKGKYVVLKVLPYKSGNSEYNGTIYFDNICVDKLSSCAPPTDLKVVSYNNDTVCMNWKATDKTGTFRIRLFNHADANPDTDAFVAETTVVDTTTAVFKGLDGNTAYYAFVRKECGDESHSAWSHWTSWRSECEAIQTLPYSEDFEDGIAGEAPHCWSQITDTYLTGGGSNCNSTTTQATIQNEDGYGKYLRLGYGYSSTCGGDPGIAKAITPLLDITSPKDIVIYFDAKSGDQNTEATILIEAVESPEEEAGAVEILTLSHIPGTSWKTYYIDLADYYTSAQSYNYLRFSSIEAMPAYMDNFHVTTDRSTILPVQELQLLSLNDTEATIGFSEITPGINQWLIEYGAKGFALGEGTQQVLDTTVVVLSELTANTEYDLYVRANVEGSTFVGPLSFTTTKAAITLPYHYNFGDAQENSQLWTLVNTDANGKEYPNTFTFGDASNVGGTGSTALYVQHDGQYGFIAKSESGENGNSYVWATRYVEIPAAGTYTFGMRAKNPGCPVVGYEKNSYVAMALVPTMRTPLAGNIRRPDGTTTTAIKTTTAYNEYNIIPAFYDVDEFEEVTQQVAIAQGGTYMLLLYWQNFPQTLNNGDIYEPVAIDSIWIEEYDCTEPSDHAIEAISDTSITVSWFAGRNTNFEVVVSRYTQSPRPDELENADKVIHTIYEGEPTITVTGLNPNTNYALYQRTICSDGPTAWNKVVFRTNCVEQILPYTELFGEIPACWYMSSGVKAGVALYRSDEMEDAGDPAEEWNYLYVPAGGYVILPDFGVEAHRLAIEMNVFNDLYLTQFEIGVVQDPYDMESFVSVQKLNTTHKLGSSSSAGNPYVVENLSTMLHRYNGDGHYVAIKCDPTSRSQIKDLAVILLPTCVAPQQVEVTDITETSAIVNWIGGTETEWEIALNTDTFTVTEQPYDLSKNVILQQGSTYTLSVRAICGENDKSAWTIPITFNTVCGVNIMPLIEDFEGFAATSSLDYTQIPMNCWKQMWSLETLDSIVKLSDATKLFTTVTARTENYLAWVVPAQSILNNNFEGKAHLQSDVWQDYWTDKSNGNKKRQKWLVLPKYHIEAYSTFTFRLAVSTLQSTTENLYGGGGKSDAGVLNIAVTTDGGKTFRKLEQIILNKYDSIFREVRIDLSDYAGQDVSLVLQHGMIYMNNAIGYPAIRIQDMRLNCTQAYEMSDNACEGYNYMENGFIISKDSLAEANASMTFTRWAANTENGCDSLITLTLTTIPNVEETIYATIYEGESYLFGNQQLTEPSPDGQPYTWLGTTAEGCDSIVNLYLSVVQMHSSRIDTVVCENELPFTWKKYQVSEAGIYADTLDVPGAEYDSVVNLYVTVNALSYQTIEEAICLGDSIYFGESFLREAGTYTETLVNQAGCDSTVTLMLSVLHPDTITLDTVVLTTDLPFVYEGQEVLGKDTEVGTYDREVVVEGTPCKVVYELHIEVKMPEGIDNVQADAFALNPTIIRTGQSVHLTWKPNTEVVNIEVCDMVGRRVATYQPGTEREVILSDFYVAGMYLVRVNTTTGAPYIGHVLAQ